VNNVLRLISRGAEPIDHVTPRPRIELHPKREPIDPPTYWEICAEATARAERKQRGDRLWKLVRQAAEGSNTSEPMPAPEPELQEVRNAGSDSG
jgi:hypothetical protein